MTATAMRRFYGIYTVVLLVVHLVLPLSWADDAVFMARASSVDLATFLSTSTRPLIDTVTYVCARCPLVWRVLDPFVMAAFVWLLSTLIPGRCTLPQTIVIGIVSLYPMLVMADAGFVATTLNYLWTITAALAALWPLVCAVRGAAPPLLAFAVAIPCLVYAVGMQQSAVVLMAALVVLLILSIKRKCAVWFAVTELVLTLVLFATSLWLTFGGDHARTALETAAYFPTYGDLSLWQRLELGFSSTWYCLTMDVQFAWFGFLAFAITLAIVVWRAQPTWTHRAVAVLLPMVTLYGGVQSLLLSTLWLTGELTNPLVGTAHYVFEPMADAVFLLLTAAMLWLVRSLFDRVSSRLFAAFLLAVGFGTRVLMGFSPGVWASGYRTFDWLFVALLAVCVWGVREEKRRRLV